MSRLLFFLLLVRISGGAAAAEQDQPMAAGIQAYQSANFHGAAQQFLEAAKTQPGSAKAYLYLGLSFWGEYIPGAASPENEAFAKGTEVALRKAVELAPNDKAAIMCLGMALYEVGQREETSAEIRKVEEAKQVMKRLIALDSHLVEAVYNLGVMDALIPSVRVLAAREKAGMGTDDPPPLRDESLRRTLREQWGGRILDAVENLDRVLQLDPNADEAMQYLLLCWRAQGDLTASPAEAAALKAKSGAMAERLRANQESFMEGRLKLRAAPDWGTEIDPYTLTMAIPPPPPPPPPGPGGPAPTNKTPLPKKKG